MLEEKKCFFKQNNLCTLNDKLIEELESIHEFKCQSSCWWYTPVYTGKDKFYLILEEYHSYMNYKNLEDVELSLFLSGHDCICENDFDNISYQAALIALVCRKYKKLKPYEFLVAVDYMKILYFKIPKSIKRKYKRIKKKLKSSNNFEYKIYLMEINNFKKSLNIEP